MVARLRGCKCENLFNNRNVVSHCSTTEQQWYTIYEKKAIKSARAIFFTSCQRLSKRGRYGIIIIIIIARKRSNNVAFFEFQIQITNVCGLIKCYIGYYNLTRPSPFFLFFTCGFYHSFLLCCCFFFVWWEMAVVRASTSMSREATAVNMYVWGMI